MPTIMYYLATAGYNAEEQQRRREIMAPFLPEDYHVVFATAHEAPEFLDEARDFDRAMAAVANHIGTIGPEQCDVMVTGGALDPGVPVARRQIRVPLVPPGEASLYVAYLAGLPTSIVTVDEHAIAATHRFVEQTAVKPEIVSMRSMATPVRRIVSDLEAGRAALVREAKAAIHEDGARAVYLGSMTLPTLGLTDYLRQELGVPVYDPLRIALKMAVEIIESRSRDDGPTA
jgi:allantoin racemase